jgi:hypothetical protein
MRRQIVSDEFEQMASGLHAQNVELQQLIAVMQEALQEVEWYAPDAPTDAFAEARRKVRVALARAKALGPFALPASSGSAHADAIGGGFDHR